jgi:transposase
MSKEVVIKNLDHLGLIAGVVDELEIENSVDKVITADASKKGLSFGVLVKAMILNGLGYVNKQLYLTPLFFKDKPLETLFSQPINANQINDDALGRTLDAIYEYGVSELYEKISHRAIKILGLTPSTVHLDSTSFHADGEYKECQSDSTLTQEDEDNPTPIKLVKGYSRDHHPNLNQVVLNLIVEHKAGIPLMMKASDGNQVDSQAFASLVDAHIDSLKAMSNTKLTLIADAALFTQKGLQTIKEKEIDFISRVSNRLKEAKELMGNIPSKELTPLDENYSFFEQTIEYAQMEQKWVVYRSELASHREDKTLLKRLLQESTQETKEAKRLKQQIFYCEVDALKALKLFQSNNPLLMFFNERVIKKAKYRSKGRPKPNEVPILYEYYLEFDITMPITTFKDKSKQESGYFILATNNLMLTPTELLLEYKSQQRVERGFRFLKSPEFLCDALFLKKPERIEAMLMIMTLCLMVYASLEYKIRKELKEQNKTFPNQLGKPIQNPTARWIFECFFAIHILYMAQMPKMIVGLNENHKNILEILGARYLRLYGLELN